MSNPYLGEIRLFAGNFAPQGWAFCDGQLLAISEHDALFQLIGTTYGGDGESTFALPDLRGRLPIHRGVGFTIGQSGGTEDVTITTNQVPAHGHPLRAADLASSETSPGNNLTAEPTKRIYGSPASVSAMAPGAIGPRGGSQPHDNMQPFLSLSFILSLFGVFPSPT